MKKKVIITSVVLLIFGIAAFVLFYLYNPRKALNLIIPEIRDITFIDASIQKGDSVFTKIDLVVQNKSPYRLSIDSIYYKINLNDTLLAESLVPLALSQKKFQVDTIKLPINVSYKKIRKLIKSLKKSDSTNVYSKFYVIYNTIFGRVKVDYDKTTRIAVPVPPQIKIVSVEQKKYNIRDKTLTATIKLQIINRGKNIDIELSNIRYHFTSKNVLSSEGLINQKLNIKPSSTAYLTLPIAIEIVHPLKTAIAIATDQDIIHYTLNLQADMKENMVNSNHRIIPVNFDATGSLELKK